MSIVRRHGSLALWLAAVARVVHAGAPLETGASFFATGWQPVIMAGSSNVAPADSIADRVDPNTAYSIYSGVGSIRVNAGSSTYIGSGTPISPTHILTAAHVFDIDGDGASDVGPSSVTFYLNREGSPSHTFSASAIFLHPAYNGHATNVNDDIAILQLASPLPAGVPTYDIVRTSLVYQTKISLVGYGQSGYGDIGYSVGPSFFVKRTGTNYLDGIWSWDDEGTNPVFEVWYGDFDAPDGSVGFSGGASVGNRLETTLGGGDSGGPGFLWEAGTPYVVSVNTFVFSYSTNSYPRFGSGLAGIHVPAYSNWIDSITGIPEPGIAALAVIGAVTVGVVRHRAAWRRRR